ncbi:MAG TPA: CPBP family intramembrane glutamic endopeptidase [Solirubrobacteraceae bacterium]|nr:CPBP family intramembrane glutamic endopeptidase [Solirubrobacteraceae bacterium]
MVWGQHGGLELLDAVWPGWHGPGSDPASRASIVPGVPWDQEWLSFAAGVVLLVGIPAILIRFVFHESLRDYGLCLPPPDRRRLTLLATVLLLAVSVLPFYVASENDAMRATYPLYRGEFDGDLDFFVYELGYLAFFVAIEFVFRGYLLFGLFRLRDRDAPPGVSGEPGPLVFGYYAILVSMLSYTAWHLGKPLLELWGTLVWGLLAGTVALATRTILPIIAVHWLLNVFLDYLLYAGA